MEIILHFFSQFINDLLIIILLIILVNNLSILILYIYIYMYKIIRKIVDDEEDDLGGFKK